MTVYQEKTTLSREHIRNTALELVRSEGIDFSMRTLAKQLNTSAMAMYRYYESRDALIAVIVDHVIAEILEAGEQFLAEKSASNWQRNLKDSSLHCFDILVQYPGVAARLVYGQNVSPTSLRMIEVNIQFLERIGLSTQRAAAIFQTSFLFLAECANAEYARFKGEASLPLFVDKAQEMISNNARLQDYVMLLGSVSIRQRLEIGLDLFITALEAEITDPDPS
ncbi:MAG: TetR family transcriptional regulator [Pseudomonadota bacterium]